MPQLNKNGWLAILFIFFCIAIPFGITYYVSTPKYKNRQKQWQNRNTAAGNAIKSQTSARQVLLLKNDRVTVKNTCLVFKGVENGQVALDLYLLELDPIYPYPQHFSAEANGNAIRFGDIIYSVKSVNNASLTLNILQTIATQ